MPNWMPWYNSLAKASWTPSPAVISLIWTVLYPIIVISFGFVFIQIYRSKVPVRLAIPFCINLAANLLFMPIFVGLKNIPLATADILLIWGTILWGSLAIWRYARWVSLAQIPYFVWVSIAAFLQVSILVLNWQSL